MRNWSAREEVSMAAKTELTLDGEQVKKAVKALQAFIKSKSSRDALFLNEPQPISLLFTLWKIPKQSQTIRIPLPHGHRSDTDEVCLFTKDEPNMTSEQTQRFYKRLLQEKGVKNVSEIIPFNVLKKEYKPYEAKRRLLGNFDMFLSDDRIRRLLPSHLGKHFYERKKEPLSVNLKSNHLARDIQRVIQGTSIKVSNRGCCCMARVGRSDMTPDELTENIEATVQTVLAKLRVLQKGRVMKLIHLKSETSVALPIYTSDLSHLSTEQAQAPKKEAAAAKEQTKNNSPTDNAAAGKVVKEKKKEDDDEEEEIPDLVPIETPRKKAKLQKPMKKKQLEKAPTAAAVKKGAKPQRKLAQRMDSKVKRKVPKVK